MILCILLLQVFTVGGNIAYADEEEKDEEKTETTTGDNNAFNTENATYIEAYKKAASYNIGMHYAVTYNILSSQYGDGSKYSGLYKGDKTSVSGATSESFKVPAEYLVGNFGGLNLYNKVTGGDKDEGSFEESTEPTKDDDYLKALDEAADALADDLAGSYANTIGRYTALTDKQISESDNSGVIGWVSRGVTRNVALWYFGIDSRTKNVDVPAAHKKSLKVALKKELKLALKTAPSVDSITKDSGAALTTELANKGISGYRKSLNNYGSKVEYTNNYMHIYKIPNSGDNKDSNKKEKGKYIDNYIQYVSESMSGQHVKDHSKEIKKKFSAATDDAFEKVDKKVYDKYVKALKKKLKQGEEAAAVSGDFHVIGWLPLLVTYTDGAPILADNSVGGSYLGALEEYDGSKLDGTNLVTKSGDPRAIRVNDMFANKSGSPLFVFKTKEYENKAVQFKAGANGNLSKESLGTYLGMKGEADWQFSLTNPVDANVKVSQPKKSDNYSQGLMKAITANPSNAGKIDTKSTDTVGVDNYGNIIVGSTGAVLIPYWQNDTILSMTKKDEAYIASPIFNDKSATKVKEAMKKFVGTDSGNTVSSKEKKASLSNVPESLRESVKTVQSALPDGGGISFDAMNKFMEKGTLSTPQDTIRALALLITADTSTEVSEWTNQFIKDAEKSKELYIDLGTGGFSSTSETTENLNRWTAARLIERIGMVFDVGFYETLRLTVASWVVSLYNSSFIGYSVNTIFHTSTITDSGMWGNLISSISLVLIGVMGVYIIVMAFKLFRKTLGFKDFAKNFIMITLIIVIPSQIYSPMVEWGINKPADFVIEKQVKQVSLLDTWLAMEEKVRERDENYTKLFGGTDQLRDRSQDYIVYFYTTTHKNGFDIDEVDESTLSLKDSIRQGLVKDGGKWNKNDLIKVGVSIFDLFDWASERFNKKTDAELFQWLETTKNDKGEYDGVGSYKEYHFDTSTKFDNLAVAQGIKNVKGVDLSASQLYLKIVENTKDEGVLNSLNSLYQVSHAVRNPVNGRAITDDEQEALLRDLSMTNASRRAAYGNTTNPFSVKTENLMTTYGYSSKPTSDFLALGELVDDLAPYRDMTTTTLDRDIYEINRALLDEYMFTYSIVRDNTTNTVGSFPDAELRMLTLSEFFAVNKELKMYAFPTDYVPESISFDSYVRMAFIPMLSFDVNNQDLDNVAQYLSLRENPLVMFVFLIALFALLLFGLTYLVVFYCVMLVAMMVAFIRNYVITQNKGNKSWLGSLVIVGTFGLAKLGLLVIWYLMTYYLNYSTGRAGGITYPYTLIHSIIIIAYIFIIMKFVFLKVFKAVLKDKGNLGGEIFANGFTRMANNLKNGVGIVRGQLSKGLTKTANTAGNALTRVLKGEGEEGGLNALAKKGLKRGLKLGRRAGTGILGYAMAKTGIDHAVDTIGAKIKDGGKAVKDGFSTSYAGRLLKHMSKADGGAFKAVSQDYYNAGESVSGIDTSKLGIDNEGSIIDSGGAEFMTMVLDSEEQAKEFEDHLKEQGINVSRDLSTVSFDTTGKDFKNSASVRKKFLGGLVEKAVTDLEDIPKPKTLHNLDSLNYSTFSRDANGKLVKGYKLDLGASGISPEGFEKIINSPAFRDFKLISAPERDGAGNYLPGTAVVEYTGIKNADLELQKMFTQDVDHRATNKLPERLSSGLEDGLDLGVPSGEMIDQVQNLMVKGMQIQDGKVLYNERNKYHRRAIKDINDKVLSNLSALRSDKLDLAQKVSSYVVEGGNNGFMNEHFKAGDGGASAIFQKLGVEEGLHYDRVFTGKGQNAGNGVRMLENLKSVVDLEGKDIVSYVKSQADVINRANKQVLGEDMDFSQGVASMLAYGRKAGIENELGAFTEKYNQLNADRERNVLSDETYNNELKEVFKGMQKTFKDNGALEGYASDKLEKSTDARDRDALTVFRNVKEDLVRNKKADGNTLSKMDFNEFSEIASIIGNIKSVKTEEDGVMTIQSTEGGISQTALDNLIKRYRD